MLAARTWLLLPLLMGSVQLACVDEPGVETSSYAEGAAPPTVETEEPSELADVDPIGRADDDWEELCSWATDAVDCDLCGGGGCVATCSLDDAPRDFGPDAGADTGADGGSDEPWTGDADCDDWYGGGGFCADCDDCCWAETCTPVDDGGSDDPTDDESDWTDADCDDWYGGGGFCADCQACCWSDGCW